MAKKKKAKKRSTTRRRRSLSGAVGAVDIMNVVSVIAGAVIAKGADKFLPETLDKKIVAGGKVALGVALPMFIKSGNLKNIASGAGAGMVAVGALDLLTDLGVLSGLGIVETKPAIFDVFADSLSGDILGAGNVLSGNDLNVINGLDDDINVIN